jgi:hypothetical protein
MILASAGIVVGCHSYKPLTDPTMAGSQMAKVQFAQPRDIVVHPSAGRDTTLRAVSSLEGRVLSTATDTVELAITKVSDATGPRAVTTSLTAKIPREPSVAIDVLSFDAGRTAAFGGAALYVAIAALFLGLIAAVYSAGS